MRFIRYRVLCAEDRSLTYDRGFSMNGAGWSGTDAETDTETKINPIRTVEDIFMMNNNTQQQQITMKTSTGS